MDKEKNLTAEDYQKILKVLTELKDKYGFFSIKLEACSGPWQRMPNVSIGCQDRKLSYPYAPFSPYLSSEESEMPWTSKSKLGKRFIKR